MTLLDPANWPLWVVCAGMIAAAIIDWWLFKVPNKLTFPLIFSGWLLGVANSFGLGAGYGGIGTSLFGTFFAMALLLPVYAIGGMGAGDVKMTMGFGAWIGAFYGFGDPEALPRVPSSVSIIFWAFVAGTIAGGIIALGMILVRQRFGDNAWHFRAILTDLFSGKGLGQIHDSANARRPRWHRLPYGVPLCIGFVGYLFYLYS